MITSRADFFGNFGCGSTGMPRPLSVTAMKPSARELDLDEGRMAGQRLVHGVVDHLGEQVVQRLLVGAADIHAGPPAHRLQPLQHLDVLGGVGFDAGPAPRAAPVRRRRPAGGCGGCGGWGGCGCVVEQVAGRGGFLLCRLGHGFPKRLAARLSRPDGREKRHATIGRSLVSDSSMQAPQRRIASTL